MLLLIGTVCLVLAGVAIAADRGPAWTRWGLTLGGAQALWISHLARPDLGIDGGLSLTLAIVPLWEMAAINAADVHPPLYYAGLHGWIAAAGLAPFAARYPTVIAGLLAVATIGAAGRRLGGPRAGQIAGWLVAIAPGVALLATTVRDFTPGLAIAGVAVWFWLGLWPEQPGGSRRGRARTIGLGLALGAGLWTTYITAVVSLALGAASILGSRRLVGAWAGANAIAGALWLPWLAFELPFFLGRAATGQTARTAGVTPEDPGYFLGETLLALAGTGQGPFGALVEWLTVAAIAGGMVWPAVRAAGRDRRPIAVGAIAGPLALAGCYALMRTWANITAVERYAIFVLPFFAPAIGAAVVRAPRRAAPAGWLLFALLAVPAIGWSRHLITERYQPSPVWHPVATVAALDDRVRPGDTVVFVTLEQPSYYEALSRRPVAWRIVPVLPSYVAGDIAANAERVLRPLTGSGRVVWLVSFLHGLPGADRVAGWLRDHAYPAGEFPTPDSTVTGFLTPRDPPDRRPIGAEFGDGLTLAAAGHPAAVPAGAGLPVELVWQTRSRPSADYTVFVHLVTPDQTRRVAGHDGLPDGGRAATSHWAPEESIVDRHGLIVPPDTPPGEYALVAGLYRDGERLPLTAGGTQVVLGPVRVAAGE